MLPEAIRLEVVTPERRLVTEVVDEVILPGTEGYLGVLPGHAPLLTELSVGELTLRRGGVRSYLSVAWGFVEVLPDRVSVMAEVAERAEDIDVERARRAQERALGRMRGRDSEVDFKRAQVALQKAIIRIQVASRGVRAGPS
jgi:F-type H+-transporting ATPase subunit epsilon